MRLRDFALLGIGVMMLFQILTSFASIDLLTRMSPAIEHILSENVRSNAAVEEMLSCLVLDEPLEKSGPRFDQALASARDNITEPEESGLLDDVEGNAPAALRGDVEARRIVTARLREMAIVNRLSMRAADEEAKRIGRAGAWAMAILGLIGFLAGTLVIRRIVRRFVGPVEEMRSVLEAQIAGESSRRLSLRTAATDLKELGNLINALIDRRSVIRFQAERDVERAALLHLMDSEPAPMALVSRLEKKMLATNRAMDRLLKDDGNERFQAQLEAGFRDDIPEDSDWTGVPVGDGMLLILNVNRV